MLLGGVNRQSQSEREQSPPEPQVQSQKGQWMMSERGTSPVLRCQTQREGVGRDGACLLPQSPHKALLNAEQCLENTDWGLIPSVLMEL